MNAYACMSCKQRAPTLNGVDFTAGAAMWVLFIIFAAWDTFVFCDLRNWIYLCSIQSAQRGGEHGCTSGSSQANSFPGPVACSVQFA